MGGLGVLVGLVASLMRRGVTDIYQLRVAACLALSKVVAGGWAAYPKAVTGARGWLHECYCPPP